MRETVRVTIRDVQAEAEFWLERGSAFPRCRNKHETTLASRPWWNVRTDTARTPGGPHRHGGSNYWCNEHLPERYRKVADSMLRGGEKNRVLQGARLLEVATPPKKREMAERMPMHVPWRAF